MHLPVLAKFGSDTFSVLALTTNRHTRVNFNVEDYSLLGYSAV
jgi:hypothetical protein